MGERTRQTRLSGGPFDPGQELCAFLASSSGCGAVVNFVGVARSEDGTVAALTLHHHPVLTQKSLEQIAMDALDRFEIDGVRIVHRHGMVKAGEPIVFAAAAARHRRDAFDAADYLMDRLKSDAVFWKQETGPSGNRWIEPT